MQKPKTQIKHDNLVAQISVLKNELGIVNKELTNKIKERNSLNNGLLSVKKELGETKQYDSDIRQVLLVRLEECDNTERTIENRLDNVKEKELALIDKIKVDKKRERERKRLDVKLLNLATQIEKDNLLLQVKQDKIDELTKQAKDIDKQNKKTDQYKNDKDREIEQLDYEIDKKLSKFENKVQDKMNQLTKIESLILEGQEKTKQPLINLKQEENKLKRRKRNFDIMVMRFNKTFQTQYPNIQLKV